MSNTNGEDNGIKEVMVGISEHIVLCNPIDGVCSRVLITKEMRYIVFRLDGNSLQVTEWHDKVVDWNDPDVITFKEVKTGVRAFSLVGGSTEDVIHIGILDNNFDYHYAKYDINNEVILVDMSKVVVKLTEEG